MRCTCEHACTTRLACLKFKQAYSCKSFSTIRVRRAVKPNLSLSQRTSRRILSARASANEEDAAAAAEAEALNSPSHVLQVGFQSSTDAEMKLSPGRQSGGPSGPGSAARSGAGATGTVPASAGSASIAAGSSAVVGDGGGGDQGILHTPTVPIGSDGSASLHTSRRQFQQFFQPSNASIGRKQQQQQQHQHQQQQQHHQQQQRHQQLGGDQTRGGRSGNGMARKSSFGIATHIKRQRAARAKRQELCSDRWFKPKKFSTQPAPFALSQTNYGMHRAAAQYARARRNGGSTPISREEFFSSIGPARELQSGLRRDDGMELVDTAAVTAAAAERAARLETIWLDKEREILEAHKDELRSVKEGARQNKQRYEQKFQDLGRKMQRERHQWMQAREQELSIIEKLQNELAVRNAARRTAESVAQTLMKAIETYERRLVAVEQKVLEELVKLRAQTISADAVAARGGIGSSGGSGAVGSNGIGGVGNGSGSRAVTEAGAGGGGGGSSGNELTAALLVQSLRAMEDMVKNLFRGRESSAQKQMDAITKRLGELENSIERKQASATDERCVR